MPSAEGPKVSIVIPVYNGVNYLAEAIDSALAQTYSNVEVLVVNDGSTDGGQTERLALSYGSRIRYLYKENGGVASALNTGIAHMTGQYFSWLSHDDVYAPEKIRRQVTALSACEADAIAYCDYTSIDGQGSVLGSHRVPDRAKRSILCFLALEVDIALHGCSLLVPKGLFERYGVFDESLKCTQDYDLWLRFAQGARFVHVDGLLVLSRQHPEQDSRTKPTLCTAEADLFHARAIAALGKGDIDRYTDGDLSSLAPIYETYRNAGYRSTATALSEILYRYASSAGDCGVAARVLAERIFPADDVQLHDHEQSLQQLLVSRSLKPVVVFYNNVWFGGGVERVLSILTRYLVCDYTVVLITLESSGGFALPAQVCHFTIGPSADYIDRLIEIAVFLGADVFVGNPNIFEDFLETYGRLTERGIKSVAVNHSYFFLPFWAPWLYSLFNRREGAFRSASAVTWPTSFSANVFGITHANSAWMPNPLTFEAALEPGSVQHRPNKVVLCVGRWYDAIKRLDRALQVFADVLHEHPDARLDIVGGYDLDIATDPGSAVPLRELLEALEIPRTQIRFLGEQASVESYYQEASVLILTSDMEGFGMVLLEAGAYGVPAVIFDTPGLDDIVTDGVNGFVVPQGDVHTMARKVAAILADKDQWETLSRHSLSMVRRFDQQLVADRWRRLLDLLVHSDDQGQIEAVLKRDFMPAMADADAFMRKTVPIYHQCIQRLVTRIESVSQELARASEAKVAPAEAPEPVVEPAPRPPLARIRGLLARTGVFKLVPTAVKRPVKVLLKRLFLRSASM